MRVVVDHSRCHGHGRCYDLAPDVFEPDQRGRVGLTVPGELPSDLESDARVAVENCPESALHARDASVTNLVREQWVVERGRANSTARGD